MAIILIIKDGDQKHQVSISGKAVVMGRSSSCDIKLTDAMCSGQHLSVKIGTNGLTTVQDLGSTNGTFLNGSKIETAYMYCGDEITIGNISMHLDKMQMNPKERSAHTSDCHTQMNYIKLEKSGKRENLVDDKILRTSDDKQANDKAEVPPPQPAQEITATDTQGDIAGEENSGSGSKPGVKTRIMKSHDEHIEKMSGRKIDMEESSGHTKMLKVSKDHLDKKKVKKHRKVKIEKKEGLASKIKGIFKKD